MKNVKTAIKSFNLIINDISIDNKTCDINIYHMSTTDGSYTYCALIPEQTVGKGKLFHFGQTVIGNVIDFSYINNNESEKLNSGKRLIYNVTLDYQLDPDHIYAVGDLYPYKGVFVGYQHVL